MVITIVANQPPIADAGSDQTVIDSDNNGSEQVTLDGTGSTDDGAINLYEWSDDLGDPIAGDNLEKRDVSCGVHEKHRQTVAFTIHDTHDHDVGVGSSIVVGDCKRDGVQAHDEGRRRPAPVRDL